MKILIIISFLFITAPFTVFAAACPQGSVCLDNPLTSAPDAKVIIGTLIKGVLAILGSLTLLMLIWGGFQWLTSAGNTEKVAKGTQTMIWAVIGVVIIFTAYILINTLTTVLTSKP